MLSSSRNRGAVTPFERLWDVRREMDRLFEGYETGPENGNTLWVPPMDVVETGEEILCHVEAPGLSREDLDIRIQGNIVTIAGEKKYERNDSRRKPDFAISSGGMAASSGASPFRRRSRRTASRLGTRTVS